MHIALDTETTGIALRHGCRPFFVSTCTEHGKIKAWEWEVDPLTRIPIWPKKDISAVKKLVHSKKNRIVLHNASFDTLALERLSVFDCESLAAKKQSIKQFFSKIDETLVASHCLDSSEKHGLKELSLRYYGLSEDDKQELHTAVNKARALAKKKGWNIARDNHPDWPHIKKPKDGWWVFDMWLPKAIATAEKFKKDHKYYHWHTVLRKYAIQDAERTIALWLLFIETLKSENLLNHYEEQRRLIPAVYNMQTRGMSLKPKTLKTEKSRYLSKAAEFEKSARKLADTSDLNLSSPKQLDKIIYGKFNCPVIKKTKTGRSTDQDTLLKLSQLSEPGSPAHEFLISILASRKFENAASFLDSYDKAAIVKVETVFDLNRRLLIPYLYANFNQTGTNTTRFSSSNPNMQNVGKPEDGSTYESKYPEFSEILRNAGLNLRSVFGPYPGREWFAIDYIQLQLRIFAYVSEEKNLIEAFDNGWDAHDFMAYMIYRYPKTHDGWEATTTQRRTGKNVNFGFIFGASPRKIEATAQKPGLWEQLQQMFPNAHKFIKATSAQVKKTGYIHTSSGYRLSVSREKPYSGVNYIVQGDEGIVVKRAMIDSDEYLEERCNDAYMIAVVHDELIFDFPKSPSNKAHVSNLGNIMVNAGESIGMKTPVDTVCISKNWADGKKLAL